jgi:hypothetical protein
MSPQKFPWEFASLSELGEKWRKPWDRVGLLERGQYIYGSATFPWLRKQLPGEEPDSYEAALWRLAIWHEMVAPERTGFLKACRNAVSDSHHESILSEWLGEKSPLSEIVEHDLLPLFRLCLECTKKLGRWTWLSDEPDETAFDDFVARSVEYCSNQKPRMLRNLPKNFWVDLRDQLLHPQGTMRQGIIKESLGILLISREGQGKMATLVFEAIDTTNEKGCLYPSPNVALVWRDKGFLESEEHAEIAVAKMLRPDGLKPRPYDVRWSLQPRLPDSLPTAIKGPSASAAQGLLLAKVAARTGSSM